jgi:hypothetical protein
MAREITGDEKTSEPESECPAPMRPRRGVSILAFFNLVVYALAAVAGGLVYLPGADGPSGKVSSGDILGTIRDADAEALTEVELTEEMINGLLQRTLIANDTGAVGDLVRHGRVWVYLHEGRAEIFMEKRILAHVSTVSIEVELDPTGTSRTLTVTGGRFGRLPVPSGSLRLVLPAFASLKDAYAKEIAAILSAKKVTFAPGKVILSL